MKRVWITGAGGLIGNYLARTAREHAPGWEVLALTHQDLELEDRASVQALFAETRPAIVIHCAGLTLSGQCQNTPELARRLNVEVTRTLSELAADIRLIFFSTDLVFDGTKGDYKENDPVNPLMVYGETKADAEKIVLQNTRHAVVRTALNGGVSPKGNRGFNEELRLAWEAGKTTKLFIDEFRSPLPAAITARAVWELVTQEATGLYHLGGAERLSRWEIGCVLAKRWPHLQARMEQETIRNFTGAPRPPDVSINCAKIQKVLSFRIPGLREWLDQNPEAAF
jgi:dTDP-4-dehydrorhamnose reductase